jgi:membrane associated rhomboid family serine protease
MKTSAKDAKIGGFILLFLSGVILGFTIIDLILRGGIHNSTNIGGIGSGVIAVFFAILCFRLAKRKRKEEN